MKIYLGKSSIERQYPCIRLLRVYTPEEKISNLFLCYFLSGLDNQLNLGYIRIGHIGQKEGERVRLPGEMSELPETYFSLGQTVRYYERIATLGKVKTLQILTLMRDVALSEELRDTAKTQNVFKNSIARNLGAIKALQFFDKAVNSKSKEIGFDYSCNLNGAKIPTTCSFNFDKENFVNGAINVLIGRNGCGKSQYLANLVATLTGENFVGKFSNADRQQFDKVIAVSYSMFDRFFLPNDIKIGTKKERSIFLQDQLRYKYIGMRDKNGDGAIKVASAALLSKRFSAAIENIANKNQLSRWREIMSPVLLDAEIDIVSASPALIRANFRKLGAGHKATLSILTGLFDELVPNSLVVVDEPENHLHPALLGHLLQSLQKMLVYKRSVAIVATHSPIIVQEFPSKYVRVIRKIDGVSKISSLKERSFGRSLDSIVSAVFGVPAEVPGYMTLLQNLIEKKWSLKKIEQYIGEELGPAARSYVISELGEP
ncbi:ATP-binding protein [Oxalobacteraceae bacterium OTU3CAMAD1]|nr:ATP-binding protein [Oxalobacteraceae bacterium OTU3CAMAD1]